MRSLVFCTFFTVVLVADWMFGVLCLHGALPHWIFVATNVPFGLIYTALESSWTGGQYILLGLTLREEQVNLFYLVMVVAQSMAYFKLYEWLRERHSLSLLKTKEDE